ncbi:MAG: MOSC domain-containing protein [Gammaproteobacteria bacterium]
MLNKITLSEIESRLDWVLASPSDTGRVASLVVRPAVNHRETPNKVMFSPQTGVTGDNWLTSCWKKLPNGKSDPEVQVAIMNARMIEVLTQDKSLWPLAGDQLFVDFDLSISNLSAGDRLRVGTAVLEITSEPHQGCNKFKQRFGADALTFVNSTLGDKHRLRGVYAKIVSAGEVCVDDAICKLKPSS